MSVEMPRPGKSNKQGHWLGENHTEDGYALCSNCGITGKDQAIYQKCKKQK